jgi:CMP-N-acetylneuraminic acid synthetase
VKGMDIYKEFMKSVSSEYYLLAHTTSPFIEPDSIQLAVNAVLHEGYDSAFSVKSIKTFCWFKGSPLNYSIFDIPRTQDIDPIIYETSAFYLFSHELLLNNRRIGNNPRMIELNDIEAIDIDDQDNYNLAIKIGGK